MGKVGELKLEEGTKIPNHIAVILDGNRRWARARGLHTLEGHRAGFEAGMKVADASREWGIHTFTVWGFSTENWDRSPDEIKYLMTLYWKMVDEIKKKAKKDQIRFVHLGRKDRFPKDLVKYIKEVEDETKIYDKHVFNVALDYGGRDELFRAIQKIQNSKFKVQSEKDIEQFLDTAGQPYPYVDLFIRTSGEQRTSGLLPWQMAYAEYYWELDHLPDMTPEKLKLAIEDYSRRRRRFGGNDAEEHLKFSPTVIAGLDVNMQKKVDLETVKEYVKQQYGMTKSLAKEAGGHLYKALKYRESHEWAMAKKDLKNLYELVRKNLGLAFEPEIVASLELKFWQDPNENNMRDLLAEKFRVSSFQATKSAHLAILAQKEAREGNWEKARGLFEKYYAALKERVA